MEDLEAIFEEYKNTYEFLFTDHLGVDHYNYHDIKLSLGQIHRCETNHMTRAHLISDGTIIKGTEMLYEDWDEVYNDGVFVKFELKTDPTIKTEGYWFISYKGKPKIYCTKSILDKGTQDDDI